MQTVTLGSTGITVCKNGFGCLPIQRDNKETAAELLRKAYRAGFNFYDTARAYSDSEEKLGYALSEERAHIIIATKSQAATGDALKKDLETSLRMLKTDYIDIYQFHNTPFCPKPGDGSGLYEAMLDAKRQGLIRHIGITNHRLFVAQEAIESGLYETLQYPFSYLAADKETELVHSCSMHNMGFIAMKSLAGGLISNAAAAYAFAAQYDSVLPIWGIQRDSELDDFIAFQTEPAVMTPELQKIIDADRKDLTGSFCRGCGYCMPCPQGIEINTCARISLFLRRSPSAQWLSTAWQNKMAKIKTCLHCNACASKCPYGLDTPKLLEENYRDYTEVLAGRRKV